MFARALLEAFPGFAAVTARDGTVVEANARTWPTARGAAPALWELPLWADADRARVRDATLRAATGAIAELELELGGHRVAFVFGPFGDDPAHPGVAVFGTEERARATLYRAVFEHAADGIFVADRDGRYITANARACALVGYTHDELTRLSMRDLLPPEAPPRLDAMPANLRVERLLLRKDNSLVPVELTGVRLPDGTILGLARDISERRRAEQQLREREEELAALSDATHEALFVHRDGVILATNRAARELYRLGPDGGVGRKLFDFIAPESADTVRQHVAAQSPEPYEGIAVRTDGTRFPAAVQARSTTFRGRPARLVALQDLTELRELRASLAAADRMASIGTLAAGVAHEINNPLAFVTVGLDELARRLGAAALPPALREDLLDIVHDARDGADRVAAIVRDLKAFSRADDDGVGPVALVPVLRYAARIALAEIKHRARLVVELGDPPAIVGNESRLGQVFLNLLVNAAQAIPVGRADQHEIRVTARTEGDRVIVTVADTGVGIDPELLPRIFEPFVTTKSHGTGLGLAICQNLVTRVGGTIEVERGGERGTRFHVALRVAPSAAVAPTAAPSAPPVVVVPARPRVLMIDDEPLLVKATRRALETEFEVEVAESATDALARFERGERFDAILCDLMMPDMTGMELHAHVAPRWPALAARFVFLTGGVFSHQAATFLETCGRPWLEKPFKLEALAATIHRVATSS